jgi:hypothetical protein
MSNTMISMLAMLAGELVLLLLVLLSIAWFRGRAARRRDERAIRLLVTRVRNSRTEREAGIGRFLDERMGLSGDALEQARSAILQSELVLLKRFAELYRRRDADGAARFDADLVTALTPYHELEVDGLVAAGEPAPVDDSELEKLREQNRRLSDELSVNMETMSKMLREFSTMFGESPGDAAAATSTVAAGLPLEPGGDQVEETVDVPEPGEGEASAQAEAPTDEALKAEAEVAVQSDSPAEPGSVAAEASVDADLSTPESVDALFAEAAEPDPEGDAVAVPEPESGTEESLDAVVSEVDIALEAGAEAREQVPAEPVGTVAQDTSEMAVEPEPQTDDVSDAGGSEATVGDAASKMSAQPSVQVEAGDDLGNVADLLEEEGPAEVVTFDDPEEFDVEVAQSGSEAFGAEESQIPAEVQTQDGELLAQEEDTDTPELDESFDVDDEEPLKAQG